jgi:hypothetical protein
MITISGSLCPVLHYEYTSNVRFVNSTPLFTMVHNDEFKPLLNGEDNKWNINYCIGAGCGTLKCFETFKEALLNNVVSSVITIIIPNKQLH